MRSTVLSFTAAVALGLAPALALAAPMQTGTTPGELPAPTQHVPLVHHPTNLSSTSRNSLISPRLPQPSVGPNGTAAQYLEAARTAIQHHRLGEAQAALENAETYLLNRSVPLGHANMPDQNPAVHNISQALDALGGHHTSEALSLIEETIPLAQRRETAMQESGSAHAGMTHGMTMSEPAGHPPAPPVAPKPKY